MEGGRTNSAHGVVRGVGEKGAGETQPALGVRYTVQPLGDVEEGVEDEEGAGEAGEGGHYSRLVWGGDRFVGGLLFSGEGGGRGGAGDVDMGRGDVKLRLRLKSTGGGGT